MKKNYNKLTLIVTLMTVLILALFANPVGVAASDAPALNGYSEKTDGTVNNDYIDLRKVYAGEFDIKASSTAITLSVDGSTTFKVDITPSDPINADLTWYSDRRDIADVSNINNNINGSGGSCQITAFAPGTAIIRVLTSNSLVIATCVVTVKPIEVQKTISLDKTNLTLTVGGTDTLIATVLPQNSPNDRLIWSSNSEVATVISSGGNIGVVTANAAGTAIIRVSTVDGTASAACMVTVKSTDVKKTISLDKTSLTLTVGGTDTLIATVLPQSAANEKLIWSSSNSNVATVGDNGSNIGIVTAKFSGTAVITVRTADNTASATCTVIVNLDSGGEKSIKLNKANLTMMVSDTDTLIATVFPESAASQGVLWSSSNSSIVSVSNTGVVTGVAEGTAVITAKTKDGTASATCKITVNPLYPYVENYVEKSISLNKYNLTMPIGSTEALILTVIPANAANRASWNSNDPSVARVSNNGVVTAVAEGTAIVTVVTEDGTQSVFCIVTVEKSSAAYNINLMQATGGTATVSHLRAAAGTTVTLSATPNANYTFSGWNANIGITNNRFVMPAHDVTITPIFVSTSKDTVSPVSQIPQLDTTEAAEAEGKAVNAVKKYIENMTNNEKMSLDEIDRLILHAEYEILKASMIIVKDDTIIIDRGSLNGLQNQAANVRNSIEKLLREEKINMIRDIRLMVGIQTTSEKSKITINMELSANSAMTADFVEVQTPNYAVSIPKGAIDAGAGTDRFVITTEEIVSTVAGNLFGNNISGAYNKFFAANTTSEVRYKVTLNKSLKTNVKYSFDPIPGNVDYQAVFRSDGTPVGGKYNPETKKIDTRIRFSDTYIVKENKKNFSDISNKSREMQDAIEILASKGIINGTSTTTYSPESSITRAEIAALIVRTLSVLDEKADGKFADVKKSDWFCAAVGSAKAYNIIKGMSATTFAPNVQILKEQLVAIAARTLRSEMRYRTPTDKEKYLKNFLDRHLLPSWGTDDFALASMCNLIVLRTDGKFNPQNTMTRGDAAIILHRLFKKIW